MNEAEEFLLAFHQRHPGCTRIAFASGENTEMGTSYYEVLSELAGDDLVLDLGCGDAHILSLLADRPSDPPAIGLDFSPDELRAAHGRHPSATLI
ncbi:MAG: class I SAM-dependent methyltransferase [Myxococcales bacterium]|nr:class I SAM-dependent methyltransferase [Myxococcales bacterium]